MLRGLPILPFVAVTVPLVLTPGASTALVLRNSIAGGTRAGLLTAVGINTGSLCYGLLTAFGFAVVLRRYPAAWTIVRMGGALYLAWLGAQSLGRAISGRTTMATRGGAAVAPRSARHVYEGLVTNLFNPAIATYYLVLLPQFIPPSAPVARSALVLTGIHVALAASWHVVWATAGGTLARTLASGWPRRALEAAAGVALLALALTMVA